MAAPEIKPVGPDDDAGVYELPAPEKRPCYEVIDDWTRAKGRKKKLKPGVYYCSMTTGSKEEPPSPVETWICGPLWIDAQTRDDDGDNHGRMLRFIPSSGAHQRTWAMPQQLLAGGGQELREELLSMGLVLSPDQHRGFHRYLCHRVPKEIVRCVTTTGWAGDDVFVLPDAVIGPHPEGVVFQAPERITGFGSAGTLTEWQDNVAALAIDNPWVMLASSAAFVGPLLVRVNVEGGGVHLFGESSTGKTTLLEASRSVWGGRDFRRQWRATANGLEGVAALHNHLLLPLDEINEIDSRHLGEAIYMIANGVGKSRASRSGAARPAKRWRVFAISTGETTLAAHLAKAGVRQYAGQSVRLIDLPAAREHGVFDHHRGHDTARAAADALLDATARFYGTAGPAFLERLTRDGRDLGEMLEKAKNLKEFGAEPGQEARAAARFALIGLAGELATEYGVTGWPEGEAMLAAVEAFQVWRGHRGRGQDEPTKIIEAVADFIDKHGGSRFECLHQVNDLVVRDRAGWRDGEIYLFTSGGLIEAVNGFDLKAAVTVLIDKGVLSPPGADGKASRLKKIRGHPVRVYVVNAEALGGCVDGR